MKNLYIKRIKLFFIAALFFYSNAAFTQSLCSNGNGTLLPDIAWQTVTTNGGYWEFNAVSGCSYTFSHCQGGGSYTADPYLRITDLSNTMIAGNDDWCSLGSELIWSCPSSGTYRIHNGDCCGTSVVVCNATTKVLAYSSSCSSCPVTPPGVPAVVGDTACGSASLTLSATVGTNGHVVHWFSSQGGSPVTVGDTLVTPLLTQTTSYYASSYDSVNACYSIQVLVNAVINQLPSLFIAGLAPVYCNTDTVAVLSLYPSGGTLTGNGVSGSTFDPALAGAGMHGITYSYTDTNGCSNTIIDTVTVGTLNFDPDVFICEGDSTILTASSGTNIQWFANPTGGSPIDTGMTFTTTVLTADTTYYYGEEPNSFQFKVDTLLATNSLVVDHNTYTGDDHGGIAVTQNYAYYVGDNNTVRYDAPGLTNPVSLPIRDGIFSDLSTGELYTLWNGTIDPVGTSVTSYSITSIRSLNTDMTLGSVIINLSSSIAVSGNYGSTTDQTGIFAGYGFLILHSSVNNTFYHIDISNGQVTTLGTYTFARTAPENWAYWGFGEFDGTDYSVVYVTNTTTISRINTNSGLITTVGTFSGLSDMACITYSPWNSRWYFHYESSSTQFGGLSETLGYADGVHTTSVQSTGGCRTAINVMVGVDAFAGNDTTVNLIGGSTQLNATGNGAVTYSWVPATGLSSDNIANPVANPTVTTTYIVTVTNSAGCVDSDTITVTVIDNTSITESELNDGFITSYPNPFKDRVNIDFARTLTANDKATMILYDVLGKEVKRFEAITGNKLIINRETLTPGIYWYNFSIYNNKANSMGKLVIMD